MRWTFSFLLFPLFLFGAQERHAFDEVRQNIQELKYSLNGLKVEQEILREQMSRHDTSRGNTFSHKLAALEKRLSLLEEMQQKLSKDLIKISDTLNSTAAQYKELQRNLQIHDRRIEDLQSLKSTIATLTGILKNSSGELYRVQKGDSLERIAKRYSVSVEAIKKANNLQSDRITVGQKLQIPNEK